MQVGNNSSLAQYQANSATQARQGETPEQPRSPDSDRPLGDDISTFAHGALGMDHPERIEAMDDATYEAGQYTKAAIAIGGILLAIV
ncbi:hypothetical protein [Ferrimonas futtsuensis]|uniref:hypothetical protein n=1 Tax=Ferrimonas futtsuensis TaxID=364764 RepID=UPI0004271AE6|nr:hypothetical protein [Ferrimonas futtsuensis]